MRAATVKSSYFAGLRDGTPFVIVVVPFAMLFGVAATEAGLDLWQTMGFTALVIAGASQFAALQMMVDDASVILIVLAALAVNRILPDDFSDDSATIGVIAPDGYATGEVENPNDADWFSVEFVEGTIYLIDLQGVDGSGESSLNLAMAAIYDASGTLLNASSDMSID